MKGVISKRDTQKKNKKQQIERTRGQPGKHKKVSLAIRGFGKPNSRSRGVNGADSLRGLIGNA